MKMDNEVEEYIKMFSKLSLREQLNEIEEHPIKARWAIEYLNEKIIQLGNMALSAGTSEFVVFKKDYNENLIKGG